MNIKIIKNKSKNIGVRRKTRDTSKGKKFIIPFLCCLFFIGVIVGTIYLNNIMNSNFFEENPNILENINLIDNNIEKSQILSTVLFKNITSLILAWIIGLSILGIPILLFWIIYEGFSLGVTLTYVLGTFGFYEGYKFLYSMMYLSTVINTIAMILLCNSSIRVTFNILKQKTTIKQEFIRHSLVCIIMLVLLILSSIIEVYSISILR